MEVLSLEKFTVKWEKQACPHYWGRVRTARGPDMGLADRWDEGAWLLKEGTFEHSGRKPASNINR